MLPDEHSVFKERHTRRTIKINIPLKVRMYYITALERLSGEKMIIHIDSFVSNYID
jgi:hypothetical protein